MKSTISLIIFILYLSFNVNGQSKDHIQEHADHDEQDHHEHDHHNHEFGVANSVVYFIKEKEFNYSLHLHYSYHFTETILDWV